MKFINRITVFLLLLLAGVTKPNQEPRFQRLNQFLVPFGTPSHPGSVQSGGSRKCVTLFPFIRAGSGKRRLDSARGKVQGNSRRVRFLKIPDRNCKTLTG
ncbi:S100P-binding protein isoform 2 [Anopheles sinensis]|uniref:S100P-binding protein isoform 2 n=1 Tax=Anopheles sinensis TaxID=74873 RepID=A0A084WTJ2_ANOSI|nr:S100P-binding protein isoform 2 [Anopheles sinensis]